MVPSLSFSSRAAAITRRAVVALLLTTTANWPVAPAQAQIFYNSELDTRMQGALENYKKGRDQHLALLTTRGDELASLEVDLRKAIIASSIARRDADVAALLDYANAVASSGDKEPIGTTLNRLIGERLAILIGEVPSQLDERQLAAIGGDDFEPIRKRAVAVSEGEVKKYEDEIKVLLKHQKITDGSRLPPGGWTPRWFCEIKANAHHPPGFKDDIQYFGRTVLAPALRLDFAEADQVSARLVSPCDSLRQTGSDESSKMPRALQFLLEPGAAFSHAGYKDWQAKIGRAQDVVARIGKAIEEAKEVESEQNKLAGDVALITEKIKKLKKENNPVTTDQIKVIAKKLADLVAQASGKKEEESKDQADQQQVAGNANSKEDSSKISLEKAIHIAELLGLDGSKLDQFSESNLVKFIGFLANPNNGKAQLEDCTSADSDKREKVLEFCVTDQLLAAIEQLDYLLLAERGVPGKIAAATLELARAKVLSEVNKARGRSLAVRLRNLDEQRRAILTEVAMLYRAKAQLADGNAEDEAAVARSLFFWSQAHNAGDLPYQLAVGSYTFIRLNELSERERIVIASRYAVLDDLFATLASYSGNGLKPAEAAAILSAAGVTAISIKEVAR